MVESRNLVKCKYEHVVEQSGVYTGHCIYGTVRTAVSDQSISFSNHAGRKTSFSDHFIFLGERAKRVTMT